MDNGYWPGAVDLPSIISLRLYCFLSVMNFFFNTTLVIEIKDWLNAKQISKAAPFGAVPPFTVSGPNHQP